MLITVFTPTYNRATLLHRVYDSLLAQTNTNFEWIIVDDGSVDGTKELVAGWQQQASFKIIYLFQQNQGKHMAINHGVKYASGELFLIADSDDKFRADTIQCFTDTWKAEPQKEHTGGIWCLCADENNIPIGSSFPSSPYYTSYADFVYKYKNVGEKWHIERTDLMRAFPFPDVKIPYFPESFVWKKIYQEHRMLCINQPLRIYFQTPGSIMNSSIKWDGILYESTEVLNSDSRYFFSNPVYFIKKCLLYTIAANVEKLGYGKAIKKVRPTWCRFIVATSYLPAYFYSRIKSLK